MPRWSPAGRRLLYRATDGMLMAVPMRATGPVRDEAVVVMPLVEPPALMPYPYDVAPDGRILAFTRPREERQPQSLAVLTNWDAALRP